MKFHFPKPQPTSMTSLDDLALSGALETKQSSLITIPEDTQRGQGGCVNKNNNVVNRNDFKAASIYHDDYANSAIDYAYVMKLVKEESLKTAGIELEKNNQNDTSQIKTEQHDVQQIQNNPLALDDSADVLCSDSSGVDKNSSYDSDVDKNSSYDSDVDKNSSYDSDVDKNSSVNLVECGRFIDLSDYTIYYSNSARHTVRNNIHSFHYVNATYTGQVKDNKRYGVGTLTFNNGAVYRGLWYNDVPQGKGEFVRDDGIKYVGAWNGTILSGIATIHYHDKKVTTKWENGNQSKIAKVKYNTGDKYEGVYINHKRKGLGVMWYENGNRYEGTWYHDFRSGKGKMTYINGNVYDGQWQRDLYEGHGEMKYGGGNIYTGNWRNGKRDGYGKYVDIHKHPITVGHWKDGQLVKGIQYIMDPSNGVVLRYDENGKFIEDNSRFAMIEDKVRFIVDKLQELEVRLDTITNNGSNSDQEISNDNNNDNNNDDFNEFDILDEFEN